MAIPIYIKALDAVMDYSIDWSDWLGTDTISVSTWTVPFGITKDSDTLSSPNTTIWLSGGSAGQRYLCTNHIVTAAAREEEQSILIVMGGK